MNRGIKVLQTSALPLGYGAILFLKEKYAKELSFEFILRIVTKLRCPNSVPFARRKCKRSNSAIAMFF